MRPFEHYNPNDGFYAHQTAAGNDQLQRLEFYSLIVADSAKGEAPIASGVTSVGRVSDPEKLSSQDGFRAPMKRKTARMPRIGKGKAVTTVPLNVFHALSGDGDSDDDEDWGEGEREQGQGQGWVLKHTQL